MSIRLLYLEVETTGEHDTEDDYDLLGAMRYLVESIPDSVTWHKVTLSESSMREAPIFQSRSTS